ncbi:hypothetical protein TrRE_jg333, partial [Triparma retinervis]
MDPVSGHRVGSGRVIWTNGDEFEGEFEGDHALSGSFISKRHSLKYIGGFDVEGKFLTSKGDTATLIYTDASSYTGEMRNGVYHGFGCLVEKNETYEGEFVNGMREGVGTLKDSSGRKTYAGQWKMGENHGEGSSWEYEGSTMDSKSWYSGGWRSGRYWGEGTLSDGDVIWEGHWVAGMRHGEGRET